MLCCVTLAFGCAAGDSNNGSGTGGSAEPMEQGGAPNDDNDGGENADSTGSAGNTDSSDSAGASPDDGSGMLDMGKDMGISVGGQWFPIWQDVSGLLQACGDDYELSSAPSCVFEGEDKVFDFGGVFVLTNPDGDRDIWFSIYLENDLLSTSRGIKVGNSLEEVFDAYGDRFYWEGDSILTYSISGIDGDAASPCIQFTIMDELVAAIEIYYPTNVT